jgi:hypothetical protein
MQMPCLRDCCPGHERVKRAKVWKHQINGNEQWTSKLDIAIKFGAIHSAAQHLDTWPLPMHSLVSVLDPEKTILAFLGTFEYGVVDFLLVQLCGAPSSEKWMDVFVSTYAGNFDWRECS